MFWTLRLYMYTTTRGPLCLVTFQLISQKGSLMSPSSVKSSSLMRYVVSSVSKRLMLPTLRWLTMLLAGACSEVVALFPNTSLFVVVTITTNMPMQNITAPGINIASLSSAVEVDPMMRSGKPILNKVMPTTSAIFAVFLVDSSSIGATSCLWDTNLPIVVCEGHPLCSTILFTRACSSSYSCVALYMAHSKPM